MRKEERAKLLTKLDDELRYGALDPRKTAHKALDLAGAFHRAGEVAAKRAARDREHHRALRSWLQMRVLETLNAPGRRAKSTMDLAREIMRVLKSGPEELRKGGRVATEDNKGCIAGGKAGANTGEKSEGVKGLVPQ